MAKQSADSVLLFKLYAEKDGTSRVFEITFGI